jgi:uncharacterized protein YukE
MAIDRRAYDTDASGQVQTTLTQLVGRVDALLSQRDQQVKSAMADFVADGVEEDYAGVERKWNNAATQTNRIVDLLRDALNKSDSVAITTVGKARTAVDSI